MASSGKKKTTFAKLARESKLRERRAEKQARKDARKRMAGTEQAPAGFEQTHAEQTPAGIEQTPAAGDRSSED